LEPLEHFLISLVKEGLVEGELRFENKAYKFSKVQGSAKVDIREMAPLLRKTSETEKREPDFKRDERDLSASKIPKVRQAARPYKYLLFLLIFVAAILLAIFGIPYLSQSSAEKNPEVILWNQVLELKTIDAFQNYLREYPQGQYSMDAIGRIEQIKQDQSKEIATRSQEEQSQIYLKQAWQAFDRNELQIAMENLTRAKEIHESDQVRKLEEKINERMDIDKKNREFAGLIEMAKSAIDQNQLDQASRYLNLAEEIKKDAQIDSLAARIEIKKTEVQKKTEDRKVDDVYKRYIKFARDYFDEENYIKALENVKKAKNIKPTDEVISLEKEIIRVRDGLSTEKQRVAREKAKAKTQQVPQTRTVKLIDLPPQMVNAYNQAIKKIEVLKLMRGIRVLGQISLSLKVREDGKITIQKINDSALKIDPLNARRNIKVKILRKISSIYLPPPIDKKGMGVMVSNWRVSYSVGTFRNKIILRRKF